MFSVCIICFEHITIVFVANLGRPIEAEDVASRLYQEVPPTTFTRTISNPEIVMKKRREKKLESKLKEIGRGLVYFMIVND